MSNTYHPLRVMSEYNAAHTPDVVITLTHAQARALSTHLWLPQAADRIQDGWSILNQIDAAMKKSACP